MRVYSKPSVVVDEVDFFVTADESVLALVLVAAKKDILFLAPLASMATQGSGSVSKSDRLLN